MIYIRSFFSVSIILFLFLNIKAQDPKTKIIDRSSLDPHFKRELVRINSSIYVAKGYGASNSTMIIGDNGLIIIDAMMSTEAAHYAMYEFRAKSTNQVKAIIYTHSHGDHRGGASVFAGDDMPEVYARKPIYSTLDGYDKISEIMDRRSKRQFGSLLRIDEKFAGIATLNRPTGGANEGIIEPTVLLENERTNINICGVNLDLVAAPGKTNDHLYVWLPESKVLICGDNFYHSFPNLYAIRGSQYRDITLWIHTLEMMIEEEAEVLISGHASPIIGKHTIKEVLTNYKDALEFIYERTMDGINKGFTPDELVDYVKLPEALSGLDYLQEYYGVVEWTVRSIYNGYLGWFDGNPSNLFPLNPVEESAKIIELIGAKEAVINKITYAINQKEYKWACKLCDHLLNVDPGYHQATRLKAKALYALADMQISSNARHYYLTVAKELEGKLD